MKNKLFLLLVPLFALLAPILRTLHELQFPLWSKGVLPIVVGVSLASLLVGAVLVALEWPQSRHAARYRLLQLLLLSSVILLVGDISFGGYAVIESLMPFGADLSAAGRTTLHVAVGLLLLFSLVAVLWAVRSNVAPILCAVFGIVFLSTITMNVLSSMSGWTVQSHASDSDPNAPPSTIFILLDGMIGAEGIDRSIPGGEEIYRLVREFHERNGFRLYGRAFSRHYISALSIPNLLNFDFTDRTYGIVSKYVIWGNSVFGPIKLFDRAGQRGSDVVVYQTLHLNFCKAGNVERCETFPSFNPFNEFNPEGGLEHATFLVVRTLDQAFAESFISHYVGRRIVQRMQSEIAATQAAPLADRYDLHGFSRWFDKFSADVLSSDRGKTYFAHFLVPHAPHVLDHDCNIQPRWSNPYYLKELRNLSGEEFFRVRSQHYREFYEQVACVYKKLGELMSAIEQTDSLRDATIVLVGDHGSRISAGRFWESLSEQDYIDNYSTLFSIRAADVAPGYDFRLVSVQQLAAELFGDLPAEALAAGSPTVAVESKDEGRMMVVGMPDFGTR